MNLAAEVERLGHMATAAGLQGLVCSPSEVSVLRERLGPKPLSGGSGDQTGLRCYG